jgi:uncharacterized protein YjbI with pentapeptide repeats
MNTAIWNVWPRTEVLLAGREGGERLDLTEVSLRGVDLSGETWPATFDGHLKDVGSATQTSSRRSAGVPRPMASTALFFMQEPPLQASLETCSFKNADLRDADYTSATGGDLDFRGADLTGRSC